MSEGKGRRGGSLNWKSKHGGAYDPNSEGIGGFPEGKALTNKLMTLLSTVNSMMQDEHGQSCMYSCSFIEEKR